MDERIVSSAQPDDLNKNDVVLFEGAFHRITGPGEDEGDLISYPTENLSGGEDDILLDPNDGEVDLYDLS